MSRSILARSLEPLVAILWGLFLVWTVWVAAVWILGIGEASLGLVPGAPEPQNADLRRALALLATNADLAWLALGVMNVHLVVTQAHGVWTARVWLGFAAGGAMLLGRMNAALGVPFGWFFFGEAMGGTLAGVAIGWLLLWAFVVIGAREAVLWKWSRASHPAVAALTGVLVFLTIVNVEAPARFIRGWWVWHSGVTREPAPVPLSNWAAWFVLPLLMAFAMREKSVVSAAAQRSVRPAIAIVLLNAIALGARVRLWLHG
jgi:hypothetical protein